MARREVIELIDDLDGSRDDTVKTRHFGLNGTVYEIELSNKNYEKLAKVLQPFVDGARVAPKLHAVKGGKSNGAGMSASERKAFNDRARAYGKAQGEKVSDRGRVPARYIEAYLKAGQPATWSSPASPVFKPAEGVPKPRSAPVKASVKAPAKKAVRKAVAS